LGKAIDDSKKNNYVYVFNHLTNAWKFSMNAMGSNIKKTGETYDSAVLTAPTTYGLAQNYPNPFNPVTTINFQLPEKNFVTLKIYDVRGNLVTTLISKEMEAGYHNVFWDASGVATGVYFYRFVSGSYVSSKKMVLMK
jgi:flagellar hook assembly protein FlgD